MKEKEWNPWVVLWAKAHGVELSKLEREPGEDLFRPDGVTPWTVFYSLWIKNKWGDFRCLCHGTPEAKECCCDDDAHRRFNLWLKQQVEG